MLNLDTHILIHSLNDRLTRDEATLLEKNRWSISSIVFWEISKLVQLGRVEIDLDDPEVTRVLSSIHP